MNKYNQDDEEQLQRLQVALTDKCELKKDILTCSTLAAAWKLLEQRYGDINELITLLIKDIKGYNQLKIPIINLYAVMQV